MTQKRNSKGQFVKGMPPWNKGKHFKAGGRSVETQFKKGVKPPQYQKIGTITKHKDGYTFIKLAEHKWQLYQRYVWEKHHHKKLKKSQIVLFLDGNRNNFAPENLMAISRKELAIINHEKLLTKDDSELSKTGVLIAKLKAKINDKKEEKKMKIETKKVIEKWKKGDVIVNEGGDYIALIVGDNHDKLCAMDIDSKAYTTNPDEIYIANNQTYFDSMEEMQDAFTANGWHKANAVLKIDADVLVGHLDED